MTTTLRPSSSNRWLACTGSLELESRYPVVPTTTEATQYGQRVHQYAQLLLTSQDPQQTMTFLHNQEPSNQELHNEALHFTNYVRDIITSTPSFSISIEKKLPLDFIHPALSGTPDVVLFNDDDIHIIDLKTGQTRVSAVDNPQLMLYACGVYRHNARSARTITLHIYQDNPRSGFNINTHQFSTTHLDHFIDSVRSTLDLVEKGIYKYTLGSHCQYCPFQNKCPAYFHKVSTHYFSLTRSQYNIDSMTIDECAHLYTLLKELSPLQETLANRLLQANQETLQAHNLSIKTRSAPMKYSDPQEALNALTTKGAPLDDVAPRTLLSPTKLKKLHKQYFTTVEPYLEPPAQTTYLASTKPPK